MRALARRGFLFGGSSGAVTVAPDLADRYGHTVHDDDWALAHFGPDVLEAPHGKEDPDGEQ